MLFKHILGLPPLQRAGTSTHSHEGDYFIHVWADVAFHEGHQHSQLLEQKLEQTRKSSTSWYQKDAELTGLPRDENCGVGFHSIPATESTLRVDLKRAAGRGSHTLGQPVTGRQELSA